ncbi:MAG: polysaccharide deacetylase family protein [Firmicutes bacterium]|nr:polysaccharide deacetylase family protein [Bacillota bacterium]
MQWGEKVAGVKSKLDTDERVLALTFDACGGPKGSGYDSDLINFLIKEKIPATLFINSRWIDANYNTFISLVKNPLFEIGNHGFRHKPLSVNGKSVYGIKGTKDPGELVEEVLVNERKIESATGKRPKYFRPGTAYCDEVAVKIVGELGEEVVNFSVLGDAGATYSREQVKKACLSSTPGSIILLHMNHPEKDTAEGIMMAVPELKKKGFRFVKLSDYPLK